MKRPKPVSSAHRVCRLLGDLYEELTNAEPPVTASAVLIIRPTR